MIRLPFSLKTPIGYGIALSIEIIAETATIYTVTSLLCLSIGSIWIIKSFVNNITNNLQQLKMDKKSTEFKNHSKLKRHFCEIVQDFSDAKQLSVGTQNIACALQNSFE